MQIVIIVQTRMGSSRLPGKALLPVLDRPLLSYQIERLTRVKSATRLLIATTTKPQDKEICDLCKKEGIACFRGDEQNVLERYLQAAKSVESDVIVRITGDCPLIDPEIVDKVIQYYLSGSFDYVSNTLKWSWPRGMDVEVFSMKALEMAFSSANSSYDQEHVTPFFYHNPKIFKLGSVVNDVDHSHLRLTVDTKEDFMLIAEILTRLYPQNPKFTFDDIASLLAKNPQLVELNAAVKQKEEDRS
ncbi:MAG: glycosyltransferase family protein [Waddliaceae bacterium]